MHKRRNDLILIISIAVVAIICIIGIISCSKKDNLKAKVYYDDEVLLEINLSNLDEEEHQYVVTGLISDLIIIASHNKIWVKESGCKDKICVNQGHIDSSNQVITCLPNHIFIRIEA